MLIKHPFFGTLATRLPDSKADRETNERFDRVRDCSL